MVIGAGMSGAPGAGELARSAGVTRLDRTPAAMAFGWMLAGVRQST